jgi:Zn-dependent protease with chaperone function
LALELLIANLFHAAVALVWLMGLRRIVRPMPPELWASLLSVAVALPALVAAARMAGLPEAPPSWTLLRASLWAELLRASSWPWKLSVTMLLAGTSAIFLIQEVLGPWRRPREDRKPPGARLAKAFERTSDAFAQRLRGYRGRRPEVYAVDGPNRGARLEGLIVPSVVVSDDLLAQLDEAELDGVLAHELAHVYRGGNLPRLGVWTLRVLQAPNPAVLVLFRHLIEAHEAACDSLAARITGRPAALASALLKVRRHDGRPRAGDGRLTRARSEIVHRSDTEATRQRVRALLDSDHLGSSSLHLLLPATIVLACLLWTIG